MPRLDRRSQGSEAIRQLMAMLQAVFREALVWERLPRSAGNPVQPVNKPPVRRKLAIVAFAPEAIERLRTSFLEGYWTTGAHGARVWRGPDPVSAILVSLMGYEGLRPEETLALEERHISNAALLIEQKAVDGELVPGQKTTATAITRQFDPVRQDLAGYRPGIERPEQGSGPRLLNAGPNGRPWTETDYRNWRSRVFQPAAAAADLAKLERVMTYVTVDGKRRRRVRSRYDGPQR